MFDYKKAALLDALLEHDPEFSVEKLKERVTKLEDEAHCAAKLKDVNSYRPNLADGTGPLTQLQLQVINHETKIANLENQVNRLHDALRTMLDSHQIQINDEQNRLQNLRWNSGL